ncbi:AAA family ATPase [Consotaella salsifontis]|uniref:MgsA AAA+ ATPase C terminal n=1 Tax=Consotaella salsifontis TaxID=1365950 RepID=A0A1T4S2P2_9HYPH|nr:AAA family ATPase [Consotaella salsifontis]SKA22580.1 hypothetical protein SAMN05428963_108217 [Consotaella salsifontis]
MAANVQSFDVWSRTKTRRGFAVDELRSVLQKSIRRGWLESAILAAYELYDNGPETEELLWRRLEIIATEDVGYGMRDAPAVIEAINQQRQRMDDRGDRWIFSAHAVRLLTEAKKDRTSMELAMWARGVTESGERTVEVQDWMVDYHTSRGDAMGRDAEHWWSQGGAQLDNQIEGLPTKYGAYLRAQHDKAQAAKG